MPDTLDIDLEFILKKGLDYSTDCFGILNKDDVVVYCNDTYASVFGLTKEEVLGKKNKVLLRSSWSMKRGIIINAENFEEWYENIEQLHKEKSQNQFETDLSDGRWFKITRTNIGDDYILLFGVDITDIKKTQASLEKANQQIERLANTDILTEVHNRRSFDFIAKKEVKRALCHQQQLSLLLMDLDFFKRINDNHGHDVGDFILREFARLCKVQLRESDYLSRIGGEEFTILLPMTDTMGAYKIAEHIRKIINNHHFYFDKNTVPIKITVSIGISSLKDAKQSIKAMMIQADKALYTAKNNGRNQVIEYS
jgi:diguanylate cyclase (GGDEF)-like protein/PAS domain S-box-containing protein